MGVMTNGRRGRLLLAVAGCLVVAAVAAGWALLRPGQAAAPRARQYLDVSACLLTGPAGVAPGSPAAPVWASMRAASLASRVMVNYLPGTSPGSVPVLLATLVQRKCGVIITSGAAPDQVAAAARANPRQRFVLVTGSAVAAAPANAVVVPPTAAPARVGQAIRALAATA